MNRIRLTFIISLFALALFSCEEDEELIFDSPEITTFEMGEGSAHATEPVAYRGSDLHMEATILASAKVSSIKISIHGHDLEVGEEETAWDFSQTYTSEQYLSTSFEFHEHIDIPATAPVGEYHVVLEVTDIAGNTSEIEGHLELRSLVHISGFEMDADVQRGEDFHVEFLIGAAHGIHSITVDIHSHGLNPAAGEIAWEFDKVFEEGYHELSEVEFHEHIDVPANVTPGEYHVMFTVADKEGNEQEYGAYIEVVSN